MSCMTAPPGMVVSTVLPQQGVPIDWRTFMIVNGGPRSVTPPELPPQCASLC
jgi:hypothetical protein